MCFAACELLLYNKGEEEPFVIIPLTDEFRIGDVYSVSVFGIDYEHPCGTLQAI